MKKKILICTLVCISTYAITVALEQPQQATEKSTTLPITVIDIKKLVLLEKYSPVLQEMHKDLALPGAVSEITVPATVSFITLQDLNRIIAQINKSDAEHILGPKNLTDILLLLYAYAFLDIQHPKVYNLLLKQAAKKISTEFLQSLSAQVSPRKTVSENNAAIQQAFYNIPLRYIKAIFETMGICYFIPHNVLQEGHTDQVLCVAYSPDGMRIASGDRSGTIIIWKSESHEIIHTIAAHAGAVNALAWNAQGTYLASGGSDKICTIWNPLSGEKTLKLTGHTDSVTTVAWHPTGTYIASGSRDASIRIWNTKNNGKLYATLPGHTGGITSIAYDHTGNSLVSGSDDRSIRIWDSIKGSLMNTLNNLSDTVRSVTCHPTQQIIAFGLRNDSVNIWDNISNSLHLLDYTNSINTVAFSPSGNQIAACSSNPKQSIRIWQYPSYNPIHISPEQRSINCISYSPDSQAIAAGLNSMKIYIWKSTENLQILITEALKNR